MFTSKPWRWPLVAALALVPFYIQETLSTESLEGSADVEDTVVAKELKKPKAQLPDFANISDTLEKKITFFNYFYPIVVYENQQILTERQLLLDKTSSKKQLRLLCEKYSKHCDSIDVAKKKQLLRRVDVVPPALVLAQAAKESGWGTSRFALQANNYFGQWCYSKGCGLIPSSRVEGASHEVRKFASPQQSVRAYLFNLNTSAAYADLRSMREKARGKQAPFYGYDLAASLLYYSEQREVYVKELQSFIRYNQLAQYDEEFWSDLEGK